MDMCLPGTRNRRTQYRAQSGQSGWPGTSLLQARGPSELGLMARRKATATSARKRPKLGLCKLGIVSATTCEWRNRHDYAANSDCNEDHYRSCLSSAP